MKDTFVVQVNINPDRSATAVHIDTAEVLHHVPHGSVVVSDQAVRPKQLISLNGHIPGKVGSILVEPFYFIKYNGQVWAVIQM